MAYDPLAGIPIAEGDSTVLVRTTTVEDTLDEPNENYQLTATLTSAGADYAGSGTATIIDDDVPTVELNPGAANNNIDIPDGEQGVFTVQVNDAAAGSVLHLSLADGSATGGEAPSSTMASTPCRVMPPMRSVLRRT